MSEEQKYWQRVIEELQGWGVTLEKTAAHMEVSVRQVSYWKAGQKPKGFLAIRLYLFHEKHRSRLHGSALHSAETK